MLSPRQSLKKTHAPGGSGSPHKSVGADYHQLQIRGYSTGSSADAMCSLMQSVTSTVAKGGESVRLLLETDDKDLLEVKHLSCINPECDTVAIFIEADLPAKIQGQFRESLEARIGKKVLLFTAGMKGIKYLKNGCEL